MLLFVYIFSFYFNCNYFFYINLYNYFNTCKLCIKNVKIIVSICMNYLNVVTKTLTKYNIYASDLFLYITIGLDLSLSIYIYMEIFQFYDDVIKNKTTFYAKKIFWENLMATRLQNFYQAIFVSKTIWQFIEDFSWRFLKTKEYWKGHPV